LDYKPGYNISPGKFGLIITNDKPHELQLFQFGMTPFFAKKQMYLFNARAEGDHNKENHTEYSGAKGIISKPSFRKPIRSQRCLVIADAFIEGTTNEGLNKPFLVYLKNKVRPFAMAGIWDRWEDSQTGESLFSFAIITTVANSLLQKLPHQRSPVILHQNNEKRWLDTDENLARITKLLQPFPAELMNAYPISNAIKSPKNDTIDLLKPVGDRLEIETDMVLKESTELQGMGNRDRKETGELENRLTKGSRYFH
jgi:putative SOS response-associated peptidase YedK